MYYIKQVQYFKISNFNVNAAGCRINYAILWSKLVLGKFNTSSKDNRAITNNDLTIDITGNHGINDRA